MGAKTRKDIISELEQKVTKASAREQVANRKIERLKSRFDRLQAAFDAQKLQSESLVDDLQAISAQKESEASDLENRCRTLRDEAAMWKAQLFEKLDCLEAGASQQQSLEQEFVHLQRAYSQVAEQLAEINPEDWERRLQASLQRAETAEKDLVCARAQTEGLKAMGTCLAAKLEKETAQRKFLKAENGDLQSQSLELTKLLNARNEELAKVKRDLFESRGDLLRLRLESESWEVLQSGLTKSEAHTERKSAAPEPLEPTHAPALTIDFPVPAYASAPTKSLLQRAGKTLGGWLNLSSKT